MTVERSKACSRCRITRPLSEFHANRIKPDGRQSYCRECFSAYQRERGQARSRSGGVTPPAEKRCARCDTVLPRAAFSTNVYRPDGLQTYCRPCNAAAIRESRARRRARTSAA